MIVLDTHAWVWWINDPGELSRPARQAIDAAVQVGGLHVSSISTWEVALLVLNDRLKLRMETEDWIAGCESLPFLSFVPVDNNIALKSTRLPGFESRDPADRIITATALAMGKALVTKDSRIRGYAPVETIW